MELTTYIITALAAYLLGSIPTGFLVGRSRGLDIRTVGSGNIGATNVFRVLGKPAGLFVLLVDALKGFLACQFAGALAWKFLMPGTDAPTATLEFLKITGGVCAILGHNYTCWLKFKGGKGIATSAGVMLALLPAAFGLSIGIWLIVILLTRYVSVASIAAAAVLPFAAWLVGRSPRMTGVAVVIGALAIFKHRANIQRLRNGTENRFGKKTEVAS